MYGLARGEFGKTQPAWEQLVHPEDRAAAVGVVQQTFETGEPVEGEWRVVWRDGSVHWIAGRFQGFKDAAGKPLRLSGVNLDITERKQAEQRLATDLAALTRMHALSLLALERGEIAPLLQEIMDTAVAIMGADKGTLQLVDGDTLRIQAQHGHARPFLEFFAAAENVASVCGEATKRGERVVVEDVEQSALFAGTASLPVLRAAGVRAVQSTPLRTRDGKLLGILTTHWPTPHRPDDQDLWRLDLLVRQAADLIEREQAEEALREANARLVEADRRKDEFLATLSHELRNPLAPIRYGLPLIQQAQLDGAAGQAVAVISRQVEQMARLLDDLLDVARITSGKIELRRARVAVASVVDKAVESALPAIQRAAHRLHVTVPDHAVWIEADAARVVQVVSNLLDNAAKYTPREGEIWLEAASEDGQAVIRVRDNGPGIPPESLGDLFTMFRRLHPPGVQGGLGIGLALAKQLVEMHGGSVEAHSEGVGHGAEFVVRLPVAGVDLPTPVSDTNDQATTRKSRLRVLIVDDNVDLVEVLELQVEQLGHEVRWAHDGQAAIPVALNFRPHVVLLDLGLPGMNGIDVARELRRHPETAQARLVALTGWGQAEDRRKTLEAGFDHHLTKPSDPQTLAALLAKVASDLAG